MVDDLGACLETSVSAEPPLCRCPLGLRGYSEGAVHVRVPRKSTSTRQIRGHLSLVPVDEQSVEEGIPVTSVHRTIFDMAATASPDDVVAMIKEAEYLGLWDRLSLGDLLERYPGKRGSRSLRLALARITEEPPGPKRSRLEERFAPFLRRHYLPLPRFNDWISLNGKNYEVDCHWPGTGQIVEFDGWQGHSTCSAFQDDRSRSAVWRQLDDEPRLLRTCGGCWV
jgi:hypothetical protein